MYNPARIERFKFYCQPVLPLVYDESLSYYEVLCKAVDYLNKVIDTQNDMIEYLKQNNISYEEFKKDLEYVKSELEKVKNGDYVSLYLDTIIKWIDENIQTLIGRIVKYVFFTIDDSGYFNANIPFAWDFINFDTGYNPEDKDTYLHLILRY